MKKLLTMLALALFCAAPAAAQGEPTPGEVAAVRELLEASRTRENFIAAMEMGMEQGGMGEMTPQIRAVLRAFMDEHFRYEDLEPEFVKVYADAFTEQEIRDLAAFYRTPLGQRVVETLPEITAASQRIAMERLQAAMPQLMQAIMEAMEEEQPAPKS
ncbi:MAG TPA: DUF2059 domain-containing protein [Longimicrobium sp.]|jgi:hypothetical protein|uniref:DUF2059 domain-containing protein n=1 Tax=Longimicrobium sp. TaxID=2029185 RepID=UPI002ED8F444